MFGIPDVFRRLNSASKWLVLWAVYQSPGLTGRKISERVGFAWAPVKNALDFLVVEKLLLRRGEARNYRYFPNERHYLYRPLLEVFALLEAPLRELFKEACERLLTVGVRLLALKATEEGLFFVVNEEREETRPLLRVFLGEKGLAGQGFEVVSLRELQRLEKIRDLPGSHQGVSIGLLLQAAEREKRLSFFNY